MELTLQQADFVKKCRDENLIISTTDGYHHKLLNNDLSFIEDIDDEVYWPIHELFPFIEEKANFDISYYKLPETTL